MESACLSGMNIKSSPAIPRPLLGQPMSACPCVITSCKAEACLANDLWHVITNRRIRECKILESRRSPRILYLLLSWSFSWGCRLAKISRIFTQLVHTYICSIYISTYSPIQPPTIDIVLLRYVAIYLNPKFNKITIGPYICLRINQ